MKNMMAKHGKNCVQLTSVRIVHAICVSVCL